jgi:hypothetical protein
MAGQGLTIHERTGATEMARRTVRGVTFDAGTGPSGTTLENLHTVRPVAPIAGEHLVVRRETGEEEVVRVHCDEGVANHVGPEPCAGNREGVGEASVGVRAGQPLSRGAPGDRQEVEGESPLR